MSNYRTGYGFDAAAFPGGRALTSNQRRRLRKKSNRCTYVYGGEYPPNPSAGHPGTSGNPARRATGHYQTAGWSGPPGECGGECVCGTTYDGFDTMAEASALLDAHIAAAPRPCTRQPLRGSFNRYVAIRTAPGQRPRLMERGAYLAQAEVAS
jgi:hypothetical protein